MQGSPGLPGLIGREGQKVSPFHYIVLNIMKTCLIDER